MVTQFKIGLLSAAVAQTLWGLFPIYWKWLAAVLPIEVLAHRNIWSAFFLAIIVVLSTNRRRIVSEVLRSKRELVGHLVSSSLIAINWLVFIWAVSNDRVVDASLGYFLSPLASVLLGYLFFKETLEKRQWFAVALAAAGVLIMVIASKTIPWIGLSLAATFSVYGMCRKRATTGPINGLFVETLLLVPAALILLFVLSSRGLLSFGMASSSVNALLVFGGLVTALPLVLYAQGAKKLPLSLSGFMVFVTPSIQFVIGWLFYKEVISAIDWVGFICIWTALLIYSWHVWSENTSDDSEGRTNIF